MLAAKQKKGPSHRVSPGLFKLSGEPMRFHLEFAGKNKKYRSWVQLGAVIQAGGGILIPLSVREVDPTVIRLVNPEDREALTEPGSYVSTDYIRDSLEVNTLLDLENYRFKPLPMQTGTTRGLGGIPYTEEEDKAIMDFMSKHKEEAGGKAVWQVMEKQHVTNRTWQSMKDHYRKVLKNRVSPDLFKLSGEPMRFYLEFDTKNRKSRSSVQLEDVIPAGGGILIPWSVREVDPTVIRLANPEDREALTEPGSYVSTDYIRDSLEGNTLLDLENYRFKPLHMQTGTPRSGRIHYTEEEDKAIMDFMSKHKEEAGANEVWQEMEKQDVTNRSWQSMKDRYRRSLKNRVTTEGSAEKQLNPPPHNQQADLEVLPGSDDEEQAPKEDIPPSPSAKRARMDNQAPESNPLEDGASGTSDRPAGEDADGDESPITKEQGTFAKVIAEFKTESDMDDGSTWDTDTVARPQPDLRREGPSESHPPARAGPAQEEPVPPTSIAHMFLLDHESQEEEGSQPGSDQEELSVEEVGQRMRALMEKTNQSLQGVTKALIKNSGDWSASLLYLMDGKGVGPFWDRHDDHLLLAGVTPELLNKYGEEGVAKRLFYLGTEENMS